MLVRLSCNFRYWFDHYSRPLLLRKQAFFFSSERFTLFSYSWNFSDTFDLTVSRKMNFECNNIFANINCIKVYGFQRNFFSIIVFLGKYTSNLFDVVSKLFFQEGIFNCLSDVCSITIYFCLLLYLQGCLFVTLHSSNCHYFSLLLELIQLFSKMPWMRNSIRISKRRVFYSKKTDKMFWNQF